ncbi:MAG TPA: ComEC/Rec2 family competence protein [Aquificales bacterium]|nr:ComEC/Rec2 family competence protein [Aquificales bacterium]
METIKKLPQKGFLILLLLSLISAFTAYKHNFKRANLNGYIQTQGEVINVIYRKVLFLDYQDRLFYFYIPKGVRIYPGDQVEVEGLAKKSYIKVKRITIKRDFLQKIRVKIHNTLKSQFLKTAQTPFEKKLGSALLFGENWFSKKEKQKLGHTGIYPLIVISGMHYALLFTFFLIFPVRWKLRYWLALSFFVFFTFLILFPKAPAYRAFISFSLFLLAKILEKQYHSLKALLIAFSLWVLIFPYWFFNVGFWLSYLASLSLILYYGNRKTPESSLFENMLKTFLGLEASLVVLTVINPILAYYFHYYSFGSFLYNQIFTLLAEGFLLIGILNMLTFWSFPPFVELQHLIASTFEWIFSKIPENVFIKVPYFPKEVMFLFVVTAIGLLLIVPKKWKLKVLVLLFLVEVFVFISL